MNTRWVWLFGLLAICLTACGAGESDTAGGTEADVHAGGDPQTDSGNDPQTDSSDDPQTDSSDDPQTEAGGDAQADAGAEPDSGTGVGELEWTLTIDVASDDDELRAVEVGADDDIVVGGCLTVYSASRHAQDLDAYVARFDAYGNELWSHTWDGDDEGADEDCVLDLVIDPAGNIHAVGFLTESRDEHMWLVSLDAAGNTLGTWSHAPGEGGDTRLTGIALTNDGALALSGNTDVGRGDSWMGQLSADRDLVWETTTDAFGLGEADLYRDIEVTSDGSIAALGVNDHVGFVATHAPNGEHSSAMWAPDGAVLERMAENPLTGELIVVGHNRRCFAGQIGDGVWGTTSFFDLDEGTQCRANGVSFSPDGRPLMTGQLYMVPEDRNVLVCELGEALEPVWCVMLDGHQDEDIGFDVVMDSTGRLIVVGSTGNGGSGNDLLIHKFAP